MTYVDREIGPWKGQTRMNTRQRSIHLIRFLIPGLLLSILAFGIMLPETASAQILQRGRIAEIVVLGASQVEEGQIHSLLRSRVGEILDPGHVTQDIKSIFSLGFFLDAKAGVEEIPGGGLRLVFLLQEKPRIAYFRFNGNSLLEASKMEETVTIRNGMVYSKQLINDNIEKLTQEYRNKGYFRVNIRSEVEEISAKRWGVTFVIEESPKVYITEINTSGNEIYSELDIRRWMRSAEVDCFSWANESGIFDENRINQDLQNISAKYLNEGYIRLKIDKPKVRMIHNAEYSKVIVDLHLTEGEQYFTGRVDVRGDLLGDQNDLIKKLELKSGEIYNPFVQNRDRFVLSEVYQEQGYAFVRVVPDVQVNDETKIVDVTYRISKGDKAYIGRILFQGNKETRDYVLRREFEVRENELYNGRALRVSQENLTRLGYFTPALALDKEETDVDNVLDIVAKVEEAQTGSLQASIGYSSQGGMTGSISLSKGNLFGRGQTVRVTAKTEQRYIKREYSFDFIEPHLFGSDISSDSSFSTLTKLDDTELGQGAIDETTLSQGLGLPILPLLKFSISLSVTARRPERGVEEPTQIRSLTPSLIYNSVNHPVFPSSGTNTVLSVAQVGGELLGGEAEYRRYRFRIQQFYSLNRENTLIAMARFRMGYLEQIGDKQIPINDRFKLGGISSVRGYGRSEIGGPYGYLDRSLNSTDVQAYDAFGDPLIDSSGKPLLISTDERTLGLNAEEMDVLRSGGISEKLINVELLFPLAGDNVRGVVFYDAGNVVAEREQYEILKEQEPGFFDLKQSVGGGIRLISPMGVFRFEYGRKLAPRKGEREDRFDFTISSLF